jgi:hypothetical protein
MMFAADGVSRGLLNFYPNFRNLRPISGIFKVFPALVVRSCCFCLSNPVVKAHPFFDAIRDSSGHVHSFAQAFQEW